MRLSAAPGSELPPTELNGKWEYYPNRLLAPELITRRAADRKFAPVPQSFNRYTDAALKLPASASATYRLKIVLPLQPARYTLRLPPLLTAARVYVNGQLEAENGHVSENAAEVAAETRVRYLPLLLGGTTELVIQVANGRFDRGGIAQPVSIASSAAMERLRFATLFRDLSIAIALMILAVYHGLLYFLGHPERSTAAYGVFCFLVGVGRLFSEEMLIADMFPALAWVQRVRIEYAIGFFDAAFFTLYLRSFFPDLRRSKPMAFMVLLPAICATLTVFLPFAAVLDLRQPMQLLMALFLPVGLYLVVRLAWRNVYGARVLMLGLLLLGAAFISDTLGRAEHHSIPMFFPYATLVFTLMQSVLISGRALQVFNENAELSRRLMRADRLRDEFLEHTSHELRTPLQAMVQTVENVRRGLSGAVAGQVQRSLAVVEESGQRLMYLIDDLRDSLRLKHGELRLNLQTVSLRKLVDPVLKLSLGLTENRQLALIDEIPEGIDDVHVDPARLQQMLLDMLSTAMRYAHSPAITVKLGEIDGQLAISVIYNGSAPDQHYTGQPSPGPDEASLRVTQKLAELMGGKFVYHRFAESQHALSITIPYEHIDALEGILARGRQRTEHRKEQDEPGSPLLKGGSAPPVGADRILVVGDHAGQNRLLQEQISPLGKTVIVAKNGAEAMLQLQAQPEITLVICDLLLADVSGIELTMNIRTLFDIGLLPIILIIDGNQSGVAASAFSAGVNDIMRRPFEKAEITARVRNLLLQREASLARESYRALNRELEIARSIQESIIPAVQPHSSNYQVQAVCLPARSIGGDFYDFIEDEDTMAVLIADVAGHGIPAALYAAMLKIAFHNLRDKARFPERLLRELNDVMVDRGERTFISCAYTFIDFRNKRLLHANAGHLPLLLQEPGKKKVRRIHPPGAVLGVRRDTPISVEMQHLHPHTRLALFTDGVIELPNGRGQFFDEERLVGLLEDMRELPLAEVKEKLLLALREFAAGEAFPDDVTFVLIDV